MPDDQNPVDSTREHRKSRRITSMIFAVYGLLAIIMTWPVIAMLPAISLALIGIPRLDKHHRNLGTSRNSV